MSFFGRFSLNRTLRRSLSLSLFLRFVNCYLATISFLPSKSSTCTITCTFETSWNENENKNKKEKKNFNVYSSFFKFVFFLSSFPFLFFGSILRPHICSSSLSFISGRYLLLLSLLLLLRVCLFARLFVAMPWLSLHSFFVILFLPCSEACL